MSSTQIEGYVCSPQQAYLWSLMRSHPGETFAAQAVIRITGASRDKVVHALGRVVARHESLRTVFHHLPGMTSPLQSIVNSGSEWLSEIDLSTRSGPQQSFDVAQQCQRAADATNKLDRFPLLKVVLIALSATEQQLIVTIPAISADADSLVLIMEEMAQELTDAAATVDSPSDAVQQYPDYATWRNELLTSGEHSSLRGYWENGDSDIRADELSFAAEKTISERVGTTAAVLEFALDASVTKGLEKFATNKRVPFGDVLLTTWALLLGRMRNASDQTIELRFNGRSHEDLRSAVGRYAQYLPLRVQWENQQSFAAMVGKVSDAVQKSAEHQDYADVLKIAEHGNAGGPVANFGFAFAEWPSAQMSGSVVVVLESITVTESRHALALAVMQASETCHVRVTYAPEKYSADKIQRLASSWTTLLANVVQCPDSPVGQLKIVSEPERHRLIVELNQTRRSFPTEKRFDQLFEEQVTRTPDNVAVAAGEQRISYSELNVRANQLANYLRRERGLTSGTLVPILLERRSEMIIAMLAVMKAGCAYVPLSPAYPPRRIAVMLEGAQPLLTITRVGLSHLLPSETEIVELDRELDLIEKHSTANPSVQTPAESLAYVLYTSGSSGRPKGVMVPHRALVNYLLWSSATYDLAAGAGVLVHTSVEFDLTITSLFAPLLVGQRLILLPDEGELIALAEALQNGSDFTLLKLTPSHLQALGQLVPSENLSGRVRVVVLGGEPLYAWMIADLRKYAPETRIINEYGPTETVVGCCSYEVRSEDTSGSIPIGRPIMNTQLYVLDENREPVPFESIGELYIGGVGVAHGYLGQELLTAERFLDNHLDQGKLYKTGDLVQYLSDGNLSFIGRNDEETKIQGFRIQPGDVEAALIEHRAIREAVVATNNSADGRVQLVAYYIPDTTEDLSLPPDDAQLRSFLLDRLPAPMVPNRFVRVDTIPMTPNGKRDINALRAADAGRPANAVPYARPRYFEEEVLAAVWSNVFGASQVGIDDNYFALGGDSLRSVQVTALARQRGVNVSVANIHRDPTIRQLAAIARAGDPWVDEIPQTMPFSLVSDEDRQKMSDNIEDAYPLNLLQEGMIYHREFSPKSAVYHAICSYRIRARFDREVMEDVCEQVVRRHPLLRTSFDLSTYSKPLQLVHRDFKTPFTFHDLRNAPERHDAVIDEWMEAEKRQGFELDEYPLIRYCVHLLEDNVFQLSYSFHHEIIDGWSDAFMVTELLTHYFSVMNEQPFHVQTSTTSFRDALVLERKALDTNAFRDFWLKDLEGAQLMRLPRLISRPKADKGEREIVKFEVPVTQELSDAVQQMARRLAVPIKTVLLAAHVRVMSVFGGGKDVLTYTVSNGRPENRDGHRVIGLFVNSLAFRMKLPGGTWSNLIMQTLDREHELLPYRRYPMAELKRQSGNEPLSETLFFFNHYHVADVLERWTNAELLGIKVYGESTFPYCINAYLAPVTKRLGMRIEFDSLQYPRELMDQIQDCYVNVLNAMVSDPEARYDTESLIAPDERSRLVDQWNRTTQPFSETGGIHRLCEQAAREMPDRVALVCGEEQISFHELHRRANRLARYLRALGVRPGVRVCLYLERSPEMIVACLGVLKAGGAYVPIDTNYPPARIRLILEDSKAQVVLTTEKHKALFSGTDMKVVALDEEALSILSCSAANLDGPNLIGDIAYIIYTSGSTGRPKGTLVTHRNLLNSTRARMAYYEDRVESFLLLSSYAFDSSVAGIFWTLCQGATLVIPSDAITGELSEIARTIEQHEITHTLTIPSLYAAMLQHEHELKAPALRVLILAGEPCPVDLFECHSQTLPSVRLFNEYGPTEATVWSTVAEGASQKTSVLVPIGRPIANTQVYVLDPFLQPAPVGVIGEIYLAGAGVARGYLHLPGLTAERFLPNPFSASPGARMYRTGDLARWLPDAQLDFLDRIDSQVKVNGFRIEMGEIEALLDTHPKVQRSVMQARDDGAGGKRLVAYILPSDGASPTPSELAAYARDNLPKFMLPSVYVLLDGLPLTPSGKVDRQALPIPPSMDRALADSYVAPRNATEEVLAGIWSQVLGVARVGIYDGFFDLGGESLRAMRIMSRVRTVFQVKLPLPTLMTGNPTIAELSTAVEAACWGAQKSPNVKTTSGGYTVGTI